MQFKAAIQKSSSRNMYLYFSIDKTTLNRVSVGFFDFLRSESDDDANAILRSTSKLLHKTGGKLQSAELAVQLLPMTRNNPLSIMKHR